ncbi:MAG: multiheme c-type cytochrome [Pirellulales bacterium]
MLRRAAYAKQLSASSDVLLVDAGGAPGGASAYDRDKFRAMLVGERLMGIAAHNLGAGELALGPDSLRELAAETNVPLISANCMRESGDRIVPPFRLCEVGQWRVLVIGVISSQFATAQVQVGDPAQAVLQVLRDATQAHHLVVVLGYLDEAELKELARRVPEVDLFLGGPTPQSVPPQQIGKSWLAAVSNKGKFLAKFTTGSTAMPLAWAGAIVELGPEIDDDVAQQRNLERWRDALVRRDFAADQTAFVSPLPPHLPSDYRVAGTQACRECHETDHGIWADSAHAHAWQTLVAVKAHGDSYCQQCHSTGYGLPGGFQSLALSSDRVNVSCESCHGPSLAHVNDPATRTTLSAREQCQKCHDRENDPEFDYASYWPQIAHGEEPTVRPASDAPQEAAR